MKVKTLFVYIFCQTNHNLGTKNELMFSFLSWWLEFFARIPIIFLYSYKNKQFVVLLESLVYRQCTRYSHVDFVIVWPKFSRHVSTWKTIQTIKYKTFSYWSTLKSRLIFTRWQETFKQGTSLSFFTFDFVLHNKFRDFLDLYKIPTKYIENWALTFFFWLELEHNSDHKSS